jgi:hypothetical protein
MIGVGGREIKGSLVVEDEIKVEKVAGHVTCLFLGHCARLSVASGVY